MWTQEGYIALHLGAIRLILNYHGRKGLPVTARVTLLDTTYKYYEDACKQSGKLSICRYSSSLLNFLTSEKVSILLSSSATTSSKCSVGSWLSYSVGLVESS
ncbi:hypothetical protein VNO77_33261 [Canavalia gladiata]|uniref:Uncharacterized protein n=1 Tax=Canavalia gladiata TaxID=3824 RepID=A0AAN9Q0D1_CANGL